MTALCYLDNTAVCQSITWKYLRFKKFNAWRIDFNKAANLCGKGGK